MESMNLFGFVLIFAAVFATTFAITWIIARRQLSKKNNQPST